MKAEQLLNGLEVEKNTQHETVIQGIADNSLDVKKDYLFVACKGFKVDGHDYIQDAINKGAAVIIGERPIHNLSAPYLKVENSRKALGIIASNYYGNPANNKLIIGITGTNGKTTTSHLLKHMLEKNGRTCSIIGTIHNVINGEVTQSVNTTPSSLTLQQMLFASNDEIVILEASSHSLSQYRVEGITFDYCLFTNLYQDHLDYHESMEAYFEAKSLLFNKLKDNGKAVVNIDNDWGGKLVRKLWDIHIEPVTVGRSKNANFTLTDFNLINATIAVEENDTLQQIHSPLFGVHNMYNTAMAYATASLLNINKDQIITSIYNFKGLSGRFEMIKLKNDITAVVDYAHTADAIYYCLKTIRTNNADKIIHVFGFRGDRDSSKRQEMLAMTFELSDQYILTLDDLNGVPYNDMTATLKTLNSAYGIEKGMVIADRTLAIKRAIELSNPGDWVIVTGKGHEKYQQQYELPVKSDKEAILYLNQKQRR